LSFDIALDLSASLIAAYSHAAAARATIIAPHNFIATLRQLLIAHGIDTRSRFAIVACLVGSLHMLETQTEASRPKRHVADLEGMAAKAKEASDFLKALAHEGRLMILCILCDGEKSVTEIERSLSLRQPTVSQQLARLRMDGLVGTRRDGKAIYYSLANEDVRTVIDAVHKAFCGRRANA
jgi:DNA-binding transcriptional ArsR family regulator